jgi:hypothetical protein
MNDACENLVTGPRNHATWLNWLSGAAVMELGGAVGRATTGRSPSAGIPAEGLLRRNGVSVARRRAWHRRSAVAGGSFTAGTIGKFRKSARPVAAVSLVKYSARGQVCRRRGVRPLPRRHCRDVPPPFHGTVALSDRLRTRGWCRSPDRNGDVQRRSFRLHDRTA